MQKPSSSQPVTPKAVSLPSEKSDSSPPFPRKCNTTTISMAIHRKPSKLAILFFACMTIPPYEKSYTNTFFVRFNPYSVKTAAQTERPHTPQFSSALGNPLSTVSR